MFKAPRWRPRRGREERTKGRRPWRGAVELLEARCLLAVFTVDTRFDLVDSNDDFTSLREAIAAANDEGANPGRDTIHFDPSLKFAMIHADYQGFDENGDPISGGAGGQFEITSDLTIDASSVGLVRIGHERGFAEFHRIFEIGGAATPTVELVNVVVQGGDANNFDGGGIYNTGALTLRNSVVGSNFAIGAGGGALKGGGIYNGPTGTLVLENSHIGEVLLDEAFLAGIGVEGEFYVVEEQRENDRLLSLAVRIPFELVDNGSADPTRIGGNVAYGPGGGIYNDGTLEIRAGSVIDGNRASSHGVGIYNAGMAVISDSRIQNHAALVSRSGVPVDNQFGGGVYNAGSLLIERSSLSENAAHQGGAVYNAGGLAVDATAWTNNVAATATTTTAGGGAILDAGSQTLISRSTFAGGAADQGGAIHNLSNPDLVLDQVTLSGNHALVGGALSTSAAGTSIVSKSTIADNEAATEGGGVYSAGMTRFDSTIVANNSSPTPEAGPDISFAAPGAGASDGYNLIATAGGHDLVDGPGGDIVGVDPLLGPLGDFGGRTQTHGLLPGSPAIDSSRTRAELLNTLTDEQIDALTDQRGQPRFVGAAVDRGAFESQPAPGMRVDTLSGDADGFYGPGEFSFTEAVLWANAVPGPDAISFSADVLEDLAAAGGATTILLPFELVVSEDLTIHGPGADLLAVSGQNAGRVLHVAAGVTASVAGLTLRDGALSGAERGAGVLNEGVLTLREVVLAENRAADNGSEGGAIANLGVLTVERSTLHDNEAGLCQQGIAVGTAVAGGPPHRSVREQFAHTALPLGANDQGQGAFCTCRGRVS